MTNQFTKSLFSWSILGVALILSATGTARASTFSFSGGTSVTGQGDGNDLTGSALGLGTQNGVSISNMTAWYVANTTSTAGNGSQTFQTAELDNYNGRNLGLAICSPGDLNCGSPYHQIDNVNTSGQQGNGSGDKNHSDEFVLIQFNTAVNINDVALATYAPINGNSQMNFTYYGFKNNPNISTSASFNAPAFLTGGSSPSGITDCAASNSGACPGIALTANSNNTDITYLLIGASVPDATNSVTQSDEFKLNSVTVTAYTATPEPSSFGMFAFGLAGLGIAGWRRCQSRDRRLLAPSRL